MMPNQETRLVTHIVDMVVDYVWKELPEDGKSRLDLYELIADNLAGMARALRGPEGKTIVEEIESANQEG